MKQDSLPATRISGVTPLRAALASLPALLLLPAVAAARPPSPRPAAATPARPVLVANWHMDETSGNVMVDSAGGHNGTIFGVQLGVPGFGGSAYGFMRGLVSVPSARALSPGRKKLTLTIHLNTTLAPARPDWDLMRKGVFGSGVGNYKVEFQPGGRASCGFLGSRGKDAELTAGPALNDGRWHTVQCVKTTKQIRLIVDGRRFIKRVRVGSISNGDPLIIGARDSGSEFFRGALDEASVVVG
jgi:hypothetical protein